MKKTDKMELDLKKIKQVAYPKHKYFQANAKKNQIVLHHTVSGDGINGDIQHWIKNKANIGTFCIIERNGTINQLFPSENTAFHLGLKGTAFMELGLPYKRLDESSIGIELDSFGGLTWNGSAWVNVYGGIVPTEKVEVYKTKYRGYQAFEKYTDAQIESTRQLLVFLGKKYGIPLIYNASMWEVSKDAMSGKAGVWSHTSYRYDKSDVHPQKRFISMLKKL